MSLTIRPDPQRPSGGYALLELPAAALPGDSALVSVYDAFSERYLGAQGWAPLRAAFGPYPVVRAQGLARLIIGPEIVNQIEEYAALRLDIAGQTHEVSWPDDVVPRPGAAALGGLFVARPEAEAPPASVPTPAPVAAPASPPVPQPPPLPGISAPPRPAPRGDETRKPWWLWAGIGLLLLILAAGLAYYLTRPPAEVSPLMPPDATPAPAPASAPAPAPAAQAPECDLPGLAARPFADQAAGLLACGGAVSPDQALNLIEAAAAAGDGQALRLLGEFYDPAAASPLETTLALGFDANLASAAGYYARARAAGDPAAAGLLAAACTALAGAGDILSQSAQEEHCTP